MMNLRWYKGHMKTKRRTYLCSYEVILKDGRSGSGSTELTISGTPDMTRIRDYILNTDEDFKSVVIFNFIKIHKSGGIRNE